MAWMSASGGFIHSLLPSLIYFSGIWAIWGMLLSLAVTPLRTSTGWSKLIYIRRMLGLSALTYTVLHVVVYLVLRELDAMSIFKELFGRWSLILATASTVGLCALGMTSTDSAVRRLGGKMWKQLQSLVYLLTLLAIFHFLLSPLAVGPLPFLMIGIFFWLMAWRLMAYFGVIKRSAALTLLALASALFTFIFELLWLDLYQHLSPKMIAISNFELDLGLSATWQVLILGLGVAIAAKVRGVRSLNS